jgi:uncharacterized membrane protein
MISQANTYIDTSEVYTEQRISKGTLDISGTAGIQMYEQRLITLVWLFAFGSVFGFAAETLFHIIRYGQFEWRGSILFLPVNVIYGIGAVTLYLATFRADKANIPYLFLSGAVTGTLVELLCSSLQRSLFGSVSWDYSSLPLNIGGHVCLLFTLFWGMLAVLWARRIQPHIDITISRVPRRIMTPLTICLFFFLIICAAVSAFAIVRWNTRPYEIQTVTIIEALIDRLFPDGIMEFFYANMKFIV